MAHLVIAGAGGVLGRAQAGELAGACYAVSALGRRPAAQHDGPGHAVPCDLRAPASAHAALARAVEERGPVDVLVYNAAHLSVAPIAEVGFEEFEETWRVCVAGAFACVQAVLPAMRERGAGTLLFSGATASLRGSARFASLTAAKFALRGFAQSLARELQPQGIHVAHVVLDGLLRGSHSVERFGGDDKRSIDPAEAARVYRSLAEQPPSAWTHELDLRPLGEKF